jgi:hypothetical protein
VIRSCTRRIAMTLASAGVAAVAVAMIGFPALAKGPLAATISGPGILRPVELTDNGAAPGQVRRLMEQTGLWFARGDLPTALEHRPSGLGAAYTLSWLSPGSPEESLEQRTIRQAIYPAADGGPVIHTPSQPGLQGWGPQVIGWFTAPAGFLDTLTQLGAPLTGASQGPPAQATTGGAPQRSNQVARLVYVAITALVAVGLVIVLRGARPQGLSEAIAAGDLGEWPPVLAALP